MLNDKPRIDAYKNAIFSNENYFKGRRVLDVGAGTGNVEVEIINTANLKQVSRVLYLSCVNFLIYRYFISTLCESGCF